MLVSLPAALKEKRLAAQKEVKWGLKMGPRRAAELGYCLAVWLVMWLVDLLG